MNNHNVRSFLTVHNGHAVSEPVDLNATKCGAGWLRFMSVRLFSHTWVITTIIYDLRCYAAAAAVSSGTGRAVYRANVVFTINVSGITCRCRRARKRRPNVAYATIYRREDGLAFRRASYNTNSNPCNSYRTAGNAYRRNAQRGRNVSTTRTETLDGEGYENKYSRNRRRPISWDDNVKLKNAIGISKNNFTHLLYNGMRLFVYLYGKNVFRPIPYIILEILKEVLHWFTTHFSVRQERCTIIFGCINHVVRDNIVFSPGANAHR